MQGSWALIRPCWGAPPECWQQATDCLHCWLRRSVRPRPATAPICSCGLANVPHVQGNCLTKAEVELGASIKERSALEKVAGNVEAREETAGNVGRVVVGVALVAAA